MSWSTAEILYFAGIVGVAVFAASGALAAAQKRLDILGFILFGTVTGIGGGTLRDLILDVDVFWVSDVLYLQVCIVASVLTFFIAPHFLSRKRFFLWMDAAGLALFSVLGTAKAYSLGVDPLVAITMGTITPTLGSVIRDILLGQEPVLLGGDVYVTVAIIGAVSYLALLNTTQEATLSSLVAILIAFLTRAGAIVFNWRLPKFSK
jgi:uncharacterized membrane protein YeiH